MLFRVAAIIGILLALLCHAPTYALNHTPKGKLAVHVAPFRWHNDFSDNLDFIEAAVNHGFNVVDVTQTVVPFESTPGNTYEPMVTVTSVSAALAADAALMLIHSHGNAGSYMVEVYPDTPAGGQRASNMYDFYVAHGVPALCLDNFNQPGAGRGLSITYGATQPVGGMTTWLNMNDGILYNATCLGGLADLDYEEYGVRAWLGYRYSCPTSWGEEDIDRFWEGMDGKWGLSGRSVDEARVATGLDAVGGEMNTTLSPAVVSVDPPSGTLVPEGGMDVTWTFDTAVNYESTPSSAISVDLANYSIGSVSWERDFASLYYNKLKARIDRSALPPDGLRNVTLLPTSIYSANGDWMKLDGNQSPSGSNGREGPSGGDPYVCQFQPGNAGRPDARVGSLVAQCVSGGVQLLWYTNSEENTVSFEVRRSSSLQGAYIPISGQIPSGGTETTRTFYEFLDPSGVSGQCYLLMETETDSSITPCAPVVIADDPPVPISPIGLQVVAGQNPKYSGIAPSTPPSADALIICPKGPLNNPSQWADALEQLREHYSSFRHHSTYLVTTATTGTSANDILFYIMDRHPEVQYVFLVGDTDKIPTWSVLDSALGILATDAPYGDRDQDGLADVAVGRLPARTSAEAATYAMKSIEYDLQSPNQEYRLHWTGLTYDVHNALASGNYARAAGDNLLALTPSGVMGTQYRATNPCCDTNPKRETQAINNLNGGTHLVWVVGTGADAHNTCHYLDNAEWITDCTPRDPGFDRAFRPFDFTLLEENGAYSFWFALSCNLGSIDSQFTYWDCIRSTFVHPIAEELLLTYRKAALTWLAPSRNSYQTENLFLGQEVLSRLTAENELTVGEVCRDAVKALANARPEAAVRAASYNFLGDPTIVMAWGGGDDPTTVASESARDYSLNVHPNPGRGTFHMRFSSPRTEEASLVVYDISGRRVRVVYSGRINAGMNSKEWDGRDEDGRPVSAGVYLTQFKALGRVLSHKIVLGK